MSKYFSPSEFRRCNPPCFITDMKPEFLELLDNVREKAGIPMVLNSAYRSKAYEFSKGRNGTSTHCKGTAVDVRANASANVFKIVKAALECGFRRIGIGNRFVHLDVDPDKVQDVIFDYYD